MADDRADDRTNGPGSQSNFGVMQERVSNIDRRLSELVDSLEKTNIAVREAAKAIEMASKPKWSIMFAAATLVSGALWAVWTIAVVPISDRVKVIESAYVPEKIHIERWGRQDNQEKEDVARLENEIKNKADSAGINRSMDTLDMEIKQLNRNLGFTEEGGAIPRHRK